MISPVTSKICSPVVNSVSGPGVFGVPGVVHIADVHMSSDGHSDEEVSCWVIEHVQSSGLPFGTLREVEEDITGFSKPSQGEQGMKVIHALSSGWRSEEHTSELQSRQ